MVDGLNRSSGAARVLGLNLDQTIAILTVMREATGRTGKEVGNALNSILSFMQRDVALNAFAREGIAVWADEAHTKFRNVIDIFDEVAARWQDMPEATKDMFVQAAEQAGLYSEELAELAGVQKEFNDLQQRDLSQAMAGIYRRNYLLALLQNWAKIDQVLISMEDSLGYSMRENERTMQTLQKQYESLKAAAQELAVAIGDAGLLYELKGLVEGTKDVITWFNGLDSTLRNLIINFVEVTAAVKVLSAIIKMAGIGGATSLLSGWAVSATAATASTRILANAVTGLGTVLANVGRGIAAFFGGPLGLALTVATAGFITLNNYMRQQEAQSQENIKRASELSKEYNNLSNQLANLKEGTEEYANIHGKLQETMNAIADIMPDVVTKWDEYGNAIAINNDLLRENIVLAQKATEANLGQALSAAIKRQQTLQEAIQKELMLSGAAEAIETEGTWWQKLTFTTPVAGILSETGDISKIEKYREELAKVGEEINRISNLMAGGSTDAGVSIPRGKIDTGGVGGSPGYVGGAPSDEKKKAADALREQLQALTDAISQLDLASKQYEATLAKTGSLLSINASEYDYLNSKIEAGTATAEDYARAQELVAVKIALLQQEQDQLHLANEKYRADVASLNSVLEEAQRQYEAFQAAGDTEHMRDAAQVVSQLQDKIQSLTNTIDQNSAKWWENQRAIMEAKQALSEDYFSRLTSWIQHMSTIGRLTVEQQIEYYKSIDRTTLALQSQWQVEEELYNLRRQSLSDAMDEIREAYEERMKQIEDEIAAEEEATQAKIDQKEKRIQAIEDETNAQIEAIQKLIDALDVEDEQSDREEAERQHNQKIADLQKEYQYHALRTGLEHQQKMAEIQREIAEEERSWELQKQEWARQDQKEAYQQQIDALREQAKSRQDAIRQEINEIKKASDTKKKELQRYYDDIQRLMNEKTMDMLTTLSMTDEQWYERGLEWMRKLAEGIRDGQTKLPSGIKDFISGAEKAKESLPSAGSGRGETPAPREPKGPVTTFSASEYIEQNDRTYAWARLIAAKMRLSVDWDANTGQVILGGKRFTPDFMKGDYAYLGLRRVGEAFGYDVRYDERTGLVSYFPKAHTGAYVAESGIAELLKGERVLSPQLTVSFDRLANVLANFPNIPERISLMQQGYGNLDRLADRIIAAIERRKGIHIERLFNAENVELADRTDMEVLSRELARAVNMLQTARG